MKRPPSSAQNAIPTEWVMLYSTSDEWEARLVRAALMNDHIRCRLQVRRRASGGSEYVLVVQQQDRSEAMELVDHVMHVLAEPPESDEPLEEPSLPETPAKPIEEVRVPKASPTAYESVVIASREGIGEIVHHIGRGFELRVGPQPYYIVEESRWDEFTDFSAQRQEFAILLRAEYGQLFSWLKENKLMAEFIRLVESTYRDVPPPRRRRDGSTFNFFAVASLGLALLSLVAILGTFPWLIGLTLMLGIVSSVKEAILLVQFAFLFSGLIAAGSGFIGYRQIIASEKRQRGSLLAILGIVLACIVIILAIIIS